MPQIYIIISIAVLACIGLVVFLMGKGKKERRLTPLASLALGFVSAGLFLRDNRLISYSLFGIGVILAVIDIYKKAKSV
jgi:hypothetical protein